MTYSIIARDPKTKTTVVGIASRVLGVGSKCVFSRPGTGAVIVQSYIDQSLGILGLEALTKTKSRNKALQTIFEYDYGASFRQIHIMDNKGATITHTGVHCHPHYAAVQEKNLSITGNYLANAQVIPTMYKAFSNNTALNIVERVFHSMNAAETAGGDARGRQSAALHIIGQSLSERLILHVDDHPAPLKELHRLFKASDALFWQPAQQKAATPLPLIY